MSNMKIRALNNTLKALIFEASKKHKTSYFSILISYKYHNDNIRDKCSSKILLNMSITSISKFHILPYMMYLTSLVKILLPVTDLNINYKMSKTSKNTRNSDFRKTREIHFCVIYPVLARHTPPSSPYSLFYYITFDHNNLNLPSPALHTEQFVNFRQAPPQRCLRRGLATRLRRLTTP